MKPWLQWWYWAILIGIGVAIYVTHAQAHSWFDPWCCNGQDCKKVDAEEIIHNPDGSISWRHCTWQQSQIRPSQTGDYFVCLFPHPSSTSPGGCRCVYQPLFF